MWPERSRWRAAIKAIGEASRSTEVTVGEDFGLIQPGCADDAFAYYNYGPELQGVPADVQQAALRGCPELRARGWLASRCAATCR